MSGRASCGTSFSSSTPARKKLTAVSTSPIARRLPISPHARNSAASNMRAAEAAFEPVNSKHRIRHDEENCADESKEASFLLRQNPTARSHPTHQQDSQHVGNHRHFHLPQMRPQQAQHQDAVNQKWN